MIDAVVRDIGLSQQSIPLIARPLGKSFVDDPDQFPVVKLGLSDVMCINGSDRARCSGCTLYKYRQRNIEVVI